MLELIFNLIHVSNYLIPSTDSSNPNVRCPALLKSFCIQATSSVRSSWKRCLKFTSCLQNAIVRFPFSRNDQFSMSLNWKGASAPAIAVLASPKLWRDQIPSPGIWLCTVWNSSHLHVSNDLLKWLCLLSEDWEVALKTWKDSLTIYWISEMLNYFPPRVLVLHTSRE